MYKKGNIKALMLLFFVFIFWAMTQNGGTSNGTSPTPTTQEVSGVEIYLTDDAVEEIDSVHAFIQQIEVVNDDGTIVIYKGQQPLTLKRDFTQKIAGATIPPGDYKEIIITFHESVTARLKNTQMEQLNLLRERWEIKINQRIEDGEMATWLLDLPIPDAVTLENGQYQFMPVDPEMRVQLREALREHINALSKEDVGKLVQMHEQAFDSNLDIDKVWERFEKLKELANKVE